MEKTQSKAATKAAGAAAPEVVVTEGAATASTSIVPTAAAAPAVAKTRLFWQKSCHSLKESTNTEIKADEQFVRTAHRVMVLPNGATEPVENIVYSLKRGKRIYYTPAINLTAEQMEAADKAAEVKAAEKAAADAKKAEEKAKKEAAKAEKAAAEATVVAATPAK